MGRCSLLTLLLFIGCCFGFVLISSIMYLVSECSLVSWGFSYMSPERKIVRYDGFKLDRPGMSCDRIGLPESIEWFYQNYQKIHKPVIIAVEGGFKSLGWKTDLWDEQYLISQVGSIIVAVENKTTDKRFGITSHHVNIPFAEFLHHTFGNDSQSSLYQYYLNLQPYQRNRVILPPLSHLTKDFDVPSFFMGGSLFAVNLWIGSSDPVQGTKSGLHHDGGDNIYVIMKGKKRVRLYAPSDAFNLYPTGHLYSVDPGGHQTYCGMADHLHWSRINLDLPESVIRERFPRFYDANFIECTVVGNEILFIPHGWWHEVTSYGVHVAVNIWTEPIDI